MRVKIIILIIINILYISAIVYGINNPSLPDINSNSKIRFQNSFKISDSLNNQIIYNSNEYGPVKDLVLTAQNNISTNSTFLIIGMQKAIIGLNTSGNKIWENNLGLNQSNNSFLVDLKNSPVNGSTKIIGLISNGTVFEMADNGTVLWSASVPETVYDLDFITTTGTFPYELIVVSENRLYYLSPMSQILQSFTFNVSLSVVKTQKSYIFAGTVNGSLYILNESMLLWKKNFDDFQHPITGINFVKDVLFASIWMNNLVVLNVTSGEIISTKNFSSIGILGLDSIFVPDQNNWSVYLSFVGGKIYSLDQAYNIHFFGIYSFNFATIIENNFTTSATNSTLVVAGDTGSFYILNPITGSVLGTTNVSISRITSLVFYDMNKDNIPDMIVGTYLGETKVIFGKNFVFPRFISDLNYIITTNEVECYALSNKPVQSLALVTSKDLLNNFSLVNNDWRTNITFLITDLKPGSIYYVKLIIIDDNQNKASIGPITIQTQNVPPDIVPILSVVILIGVIAIGTIYIVIGTIIRHQAYRNAEIYLKNGNYSEAIKYFYKARARERIFEIVRLIMSNPDLSVKMNEIARMAELEEYLQEIQDIVTHEI